MAARTLVHQQRPDLLLKKLRPVRRRRCAQAKDQQQECQKASAHGKVGHYKKLPRGRAIIRIYDS